MRASVTGAAVYRATADVLPNGKLVSTKRNALGKKVKAGSGEQCLPQAPIDSNAVGRCASPDLTADTMRQQPVRLIEVDFTGRKAARIVRKVIYRTLPHEYLERARDSSLDPIEQAAFQAARPFVEQARLVRLQALDALRKGRHAWRTMYAKLMEWSVRSSTLQFDNFVDRMLYRYLHWSIQELDRANRFIKNTLELSPECLSSCAMYKKENIRVQWNSNDERNHKRSLIT